jgi:hypothetical protein
VGREVTTIRDEVRIRLQFLNHGPDWRIRHASLVVVHSFWMETFLNEVHVTRKGCISIVPQE